MSGGAWSTGDVATGDRMNRKGWLCDTGANIAAFAAPQEGMHAYCTSTGSGLYKGNEYAYDGTGWKLVKRDTGAPLIREVAKGTLAGAADSLTISNIPAAENIILLIRKEASTAADIRLQFNGDQNASYAYRASADGAADATQASDAVIVITQNNNTLPSFSVVEISNRANEEKIVTALDVTQNTAGAATAPGRGQVVGKWANISARISSITLTNGAAGDYAAGTEVVVLAESADERYPEFWEELGSATLGSAGDDIDVTSFAARKYLMIEAHLIASSAIVGALTFNNDGGNNYAVRGSANGAADSTSTTQSSIDESGTQTTIIDGIIHTVNVSTKEKGAIGLISISSAAGAGTVPNRREVVGKWDNVAAQIMSVSLTNAQAGDFGIGTRIEVWGSD